MTRHCVVALLSLAAVTFAGCSDSGPDRPETVAVTGKVTYNGDPVEGATVTFVPENGKHPAVDISDESGQYKLTTFAKDDGAVPGQYQVKIVKAEVPKQSSGAASSGGDEERMPVMSPNWRPPEPKSLIPTRYADSNSSGLSAEVTESSEQNVFDFALED